MLVSKTRNNHYVPHWYQEGFFEPGRNTFAYLDLNPDRHELPDGRFVLERSQFDAPTSRAFRQRDLYSTFFGTSVNDEIERKLFGDIDTRGAHAVRAFAQDDPGEWHRHFTTFFEYLDIQKIRTPKGLDWLKSQYPTLTQNELMFEMQGIRMMHCTIWTEGVREIVSAEDADVKFITSDHPVTVYNYAIPAGGDGKQYPFDPHIALKASQTIFPLNRDHCLILTNLEYAQDHGASPLEKRTFAGNYRHSMVRTDAFIRTRTLSSAEVIRVNRVLKARAKRYIAASKEEWLYPEAASKEPWSELRETFLPPRDDLWRFGGEMYASYDNGDVYYQDALGRTEKEREFLKKPARERSPSPRDLCGCGSARSFGDCCRNKPLALRRTWLELSIRERNLMLFRGITNILGIANDRDWVTIRREITDDKIKEVYGLYDALWPRETNLLSLLPKPDGEARAIYTGVLHPSTISNHALGLSLYFDDLLIQDPFIHPRSVNKKYSPLEHPKTYRQEFLKSVVLFMAIIPLVEQGLVTLFPDPCTFDLHLRDQSFEMAKLRLRGAKPGPKDEASFMELMKDEHKRSMLLAPRDGLLRMIGRDFPTHTAAQLDEMMKGFDLLREQDPLSVLQEGSLEGDDGGQLTPFKMAPNFEITMYLAQATASCIVTDSRFRWGELLAATRIGMQGASPLASLRASMNEAAFPFLHAVDTIGELAANGIFAEYPALMRKVFRYLSIYSAKGAKPNVEANLNAEFKRSHAAVAGRTKTLNGILTKAKVTCLFPSGGIQDNSVNRLILMSSSDHHLSSVPMALFVESKGG